MAATTGRRKCALDGVAKNFKSPNGGFSPNIFYTTLSDRYGKRYVTLHRESADDPGRIMWALYSEK